MTATHLMRNAGKVVNYRDAHPIIAKMEAIEDTLFGWPDMPTDLALPLHTHWWNLHATLPASQQAEMAETTNVPKPTVPWWDQLCMDGVHLPLPDRTV